MVGIERTQRALCRAAEEEQQQQQPQQYQQEQQEQQEDVDEGPHDDIFKNMFNDPNAARKEGRGRSIGCST